MENNHPEITPCPMCGEPILPNAVSCEQCGEQFPQNIRIEFRKTFSASWKIFKTQKCKHIAVGLIPSLLIIVPALWTMVFHSEDRKFQRPIHPIEVFALVIDILVLVYFTMGWHHFSLKMVTEKKGKFRVFFAVKIQHFLKLSAIVLLIFLSLWKSAPPNIILTTAPIFLYCAGFFLVSLHYLFLSFIADKNQTIKQGSQKLKIWNRLLGIQMISFGLYYFSACIVFAIVMILALYRNFPEASNTPDLFLLFSASGFYFLYQIVITSIIINLQTIAYCRLTGQPTIE